MNTNQWRLRLMVILHLIALVVISFCLRSGESLLTVSTVFSILGSQSTLLPAWLFWGQTSFLLRLLIAASYPWVIEYVFRVSLSHSYGGQGLQWTLLMMTPATLTCGTMCLMRCSVATSNQIFPHQYSLKQLLVLVAVLAPWLALARSLDIENTHIFRSRVQAIMAMGLGLTATSTLLTTVSNRSRIIWGALIGTVIAIIFVTTVILYEPVRDVWWSIPIFVATSLVVCVSAIPLRLAGYRLIRVGPAAKGEAPSPL